MKRGLAASTVLIGFLSFVLCHPGVAQVQTLYSLGVSLDGLPGPLIRTEDGSFYVVLAAGGRAGLGSIAHVNSTASARATVFDFADSSTNPTVSPGTIVAITNGLIYGAFTDFPASGSTNLLYRVGTNGSGFNIIRGLPQLYSSILLGSDNRFYVLHNSQLDRFEIDGNGLVPLTTNLDVSRLFEGSDGMLYGYSGTVIRRLNKDGSQVTTLTNTTRGIISLIQGKDGRLYGTTDDFPNGQVPFVVNSDGTGFRALGHLDSGGQDSNDGSLLDGGDAKLYVTFTVGPQSPATSILGIDQSSGAVNKVVDLPNSFAANTGTQFITLGADGLLYGSASQGGTNGAGLIYTISRSGNDLAQALQFGGTPGSFIQSALTLGLDGRLYGTARQGGFADRGIVFALNTDGSDFTILKQFVSPTDGASPRGGVVQAGDGTLYGTTEEGGANGGGTVFRLNPDGLGFLTLTNFGVATGTNPVAQLLLASDGNLYGSCINGGLTPTNGTLWKIQTNGAGLAVIKSFAVNGTEGRRPFASLTEGADGMLYGVTDMGGSTNKGVVFKLARNGSGFTVLRNLLGFGEPANPEGRLLQLVDGTLIGTSAAGGSAGLGSIFQIQTNGSSYKVIHSFVSTNGDGRTPIGGLAVAGDGSLIGTTRFGGGRSAGSVFKINSDGSGYQILYRFSTNYPAAQEPWAALTPNRDGSHLYGSASLGGAAFGGIIFKLDLLTAGTPSLHIQSLGTFFELSWPDSGTAVQLQLNADLSNPTGWQPAPGQPTLVNGTNHVQITASTGRQFYRLAKP